MLTTFIQGIVLYAVLWGFWRVVRRYLGKTPLDNIPGPPSPSLLGGNFPQLFHVDGWDFHKNIADKYGSVIKVKALFGENQLYVFDPMALRHILVKFPDVYEEPPAFIEGNRLIFGDALFATLGNQHHRQRKMLNSAFSIAHLREMVPLFYAVTYKLRALIAQKVEAAPQEIDLISWIGRTALELFGQSGLGCSFDSLAEDSPPHPFSTSIKGLAPAMLRILSAHLFLAWPAVLRIGTPKFRRYVVGLLPWKDLHDLRDIVDIMYNISVEIFHSKKRLLAGDNAVASERGKDILSILMRANMDASEEEKLDESELIAQVSSLTFAATDTTTNALARILHILSHNQDAQDKLRREISEARAKHGDLDYDELALLPYLDAVCRETLRLYPPVSSLLRITRRDIAMPLPNPIKGLDGQDIKEIPIPKNTTIIISILAANRNPDIWGLDCLEWVPERWLNPLPPSLTNAHIPGIYSHMLTFLGGGRACIGFKFAQLELKVVLSVLIESFRFSPSDKEIYWKMNTIANPTVVGQNGKAQLPLKVSIV